MEDKHSIAMGEVIDSDAAPGSETMPSMADEAISSGEGVADCDNAVRPLQEKGKKPRFAP
ncbi:MAG: hypothetical protein HZB23_06135 [Deltaproteobacteria bacterium]|nr:hypothetical protein [Deltaproteobacteria bacterium]